MSQAFCTSIDYQSEPNPSSHTDQSSCLEEKFYYFAYGSCMCPVDLQRSLKENMVPYVVGTAILKDHRLGFYHRCSRRNGGALDIVPTKDGHVHGVLYHLPCRLSELLDHREEVPENSYHPVKIKVECGDHEYHNVRTYMVVDKLNNELAPNDWYFNVVMRGAVTCGLPEEYCWSLFNHMKNLQLFPKNQLLDQAIRLICSINKFD